eukprot:3355123-Lingulodinium_polyedra.AAC.1
MVPRCATVSGVVPSDIHGAGVAQHWAGAQVFAADDGSASDAVAHGSFLGLAVRVLVPRRCVPPSWNDF